MSDLILYTSEDGKTHLNLRIEGETIWLNQLKIAELFQTTKQNISLHAKNIFEDGELTPEATVKEPLTVQTEGTRKVERSQSFLIIQVSFFSEVRFLHRRFAEMQSAFFIIGFHLLPIFLHPLSMNILILETTFPNAEKATEISNILIKEKLAACAQISSSITSIYIWKDRLEQELEVSVSIKTSHQSKAAIESRLIELHPYELPQILWKEALGSKEYGKWIEEQTI